MTAALAAAEAHVPVVQPRCAARGRRPPRGRGAARGGGRSPAAGGRPACRRARSRRQPVGGAVGRGVQMGAAGHLAVGQGVADQDQHRQGGAGGAQVVGQGADGGADHLLVRPGGPDHDGGGRLRSRSRSPGRAVRRPARRGGPPRGRPPWWRRGRRTRRPTRRAGMESCVRPASRVSTTLWETPGWVSSRPSVAAAARQRGHPGHDLPRSLMGEAPVDLLTDGAVTGRDPRSGGGRSGCRPDAGRRPRPRPRASWWPSRGLRCRSGSARAPPRARATTPRSPPRPAARRRAPRRVIRSGAPGAGADEGDHGATFPVVGRDDHRRQVRGGHRPWPRPRRRPTRSPGMPRSSPATAGAVGAAEPESAGRLRRWLAAGRGSLRRQFGQPPAALVDHDRGGRVGRSAARSSPSRAVRMLIRVRSSAMTVPVRAARAWKAMIPGTWVTCGRGPPLHDPLGPPPRRSNR